ncbi:MAG TPA: MFS transporter [Actinophytocola sp.]|jgi:Na+/melibiose symporter-like transporter|uniref:MFS transporter n=1 Tax=Actinophytocola sp. TaxID=1872138 RepID=UPI002DFF99A9|nr:MFS transporter [Actinophytocola sp.]
MTESDHSGAVGTMVPQGLRRNRNYRRVWVSQAVSLLGDEVLATAIMLYLGIAAGDQPWGPAAVAGVLIARTIPVLLFSLVGGVYADRWDRRRLMLAMDAARAGLVAGLAVLLLTGTGLPVGVQLGAIYLVITLSALAALFFNPARYGLLATIVADADRERMASLTQGTAALAGIIGPPLAAGMLAATDAPWSLLFTAAGFAISYTALVKVRAARAGEPVRPGQRPGVWRDLLTGMRYVAGNRLLRIMLTTTVLIGIGVEAIGTLDIFFIMRNLHASAQMYGVLGGVYAVGTLAGAALAAGLGARLGATRVYAYGFLLTGLLLATYSRMTTLTGGIIMLGLTGVPTAAAYSMVGPLIMRATPENLIGRVSAMFNQADQFATLVTVSVTAWLAGTVLRDLDRTVAGVHFGTIDSVFLVAGILIAATGLWLTRALRTEWKDT